MITFQIEKFTDTFNEFEELFFLHYQELPLDKNHVVFEMQFKSYLEKDKNNQLFFATIRDDSKPIGYFLGFIDWALHYKDCQTCTGDIFFIHPEYRGRLLSKRLFKFSEQELKDKNVKRLFVGVNLANSAGRLLELIDFKAFEVLYYKSLT